MGNIGLAATWQMGHHTYDLGDYRVGFVTGTKGLGLEINKAFKRWRLRNNVGWCRGGGGAKDCTWCWEEGTVPTGIKSMIWGLWGLA